MPPWIEKVVQRLEPQHDWDDLTLPDGPSAALERINDRIKSERGAALKGRSAASDLTALFAGSETTPKLIAAEALAGGVGTDVYRVDLSMVVSDDLVETERILKRILDAAEEAGGVLFFDEGDTLIRPTEDDPYPERGAGYLLKRMSRFAGVSILSVSDRRTMDPALLRRFRYTVSFE
ncbi:MAG: AAA family ATPase [Actinomycetota bacterium]